MKNFGFLQIKRFNDWFRPKGIRAGIISTIILLLIAGTYFFVYATGGITYVYSHSMYIPIILAALFFRMPGGVIAALIGGVVLGPFMPLDVATGEMQTTINWLYRTFIFVLTGGLIGFITSVIDSQIRRIEWHLYHDSITGLPNRALLEYTWLRLIEENPVEMTSAVILINLNNFNEISNTFGIENTESLLNQISGRLKNVTSLTPICELIPSMIGMVISQGKNEDQINQIAKTLIHLMRDPFSIEDIPIFLDISIGVALYPHHGENPSILLRKAENAVYTAREKRLDYWIYEDTLDTSSKENMALLGSINSALKEDQFKVYYQPILNLISGDVAGMEALIRWQYPENGLLSPNAFIPLMEDTSLMYTYQEWLIEKVFRQIKIWEDRGESLSCSINLSARGLNHIRFERPIIKLLEQYQIPPHQVMFEITESVVMLDPEEALQSLSQMKEIGFKLAIDDFGTGYSSLNYLKKLPVDYLKIDLDFIRDLHRSEKDREIVRAILASAHALGLKVIAEGVETYEAFKWLQEQGCDFAQGYYFAVPVPTEDVFKWLKEYSFENYSQQFQLY